MNCVLLPHTVVFERNKLSEWYYYSSKKSEFKKKKMVDLTAVLAKFKSFKKEGEVVAAFYHYEAAKAADKLPEITVEYFTAGELGRPG